MLRDLKLYIELRSLSIEQIEKKKQKTKKHELEGNLVTQLLANFNVNKILYYF